MSSAWNLDAYRHLSLAECHWRLCRRFMARFRYRFPEEQTVALAQIFANTQLLMKGDADKTMELVLDLVKDDVPKDSGASVDVKRERESVENAVVKIEIDLDSSSTETIVKQEPEEDVKPLKRPLKKELKEEASEVDDEPKFKTFKGLAENPETAGDINQARPFHEALPAEACSNCSSADSTKTKQAKSESHSEIMAELTLFKPVLGIMTIEDVYHNLVIFDRDFMKTSNEFNKLGSGFLTFTGYQLNNRQYRGRICARQFILIETWESSFERAKKKARSEFFRKMAAFCHRIVSKHPSYMAENQVARIEDPATNMKYYKKIIKKLKKDATKQDLQFSADFSRQERDDLRSIAWKLGLTTQIVGRMRQLKIIGQPMPALAIVERILVHKDPDLCQLYKVIPPRRNYGRS